MKCRDILKFVVNAKALALLMMHHTMSIQTKKDCYVLIEELDKAITELRRRN
jgi:hypothetical protein